MLDVMTDFSAWIGRESTERGEMSPHVANMLGATLAPGWRASDAARGARAPQLWHWAAFPLSSPMEDLARDGHPKLGDFLPPVPLERRMWAAGALTFRKPIRIGETLERRSRIASVAEKSGASGVMVFVTVEHEIVGEAGLAIEERQDIVYLAIPPAFRPPKEIEPIDAPDHEERVEIGEARLFRYSAATFNAHRIHYDLPYAMEVEKYPGLVVHGPLQATLLIDAATRWRGAEPTRFSFRGVHPLFHHDEPRLMGRDEEEAGPMTLCVATGGRQTLTAKAEWT